MKKTSINDMLRSSDDKNIKRISDSYDIISDKKKEELYSRIAERTELGSDSEYTDKVSGVEVRRNSNILRYIGSAAACIAVIAITLSPNVSWATFKRNVESSPEEKAITMLLRFLKYFFNSSSLFICFCTLRMQKF